MTLNDVTLPLRVPAARGAPRPKGKGSDGLSEREERQRRLLPRPRDDSGGSSSPLVFQSVHLMTDWDDAPRFGRLPDGARAIMRPSAYGLITDGTGRLAVVRTPKGLFLLGGAVERGESARDAIVRECREEVGLAVHLGDWSVRAVEILYATIEKAYFEKHNAFIEGFAHGPPVGAGEPDHELNWLIVDQAVEELLHPSHRWAAAQWLGARSTS